MSSAKMALLYDFDHTLSPKDMQEYHYIAKLGFKNPQDFWDECARFTKENNMDGILSYMLMMVRFNPEVTRDMLVEEGRYLTYYPGVADWFDRINAYGAANGIQIEHYIISSGIKEIVEGCSIADRFTKIYACSFAYDQAGRVLWPSRVVNYTTKTQYIFRINKGVLDETNDFDLNRSTPDEQKAIPFENIVYFGDGLTDVPSMKVVLQEGGQTIAIYDSKEAKETLAHDLKKDKRATFALKADYSAGSKIEEVVKTMIDAAVARMHLNDLKNQE